MPRSILRRSSSGPVSQLLDHKQPRRQAILIALGETLARSARDDVVDVFDIVFADLQRNARNRGQQRRVAELRTYDRAVAEIHTAISQIFAAIDDRNELDEVIDSLRIDQQRLVTAMSTVEDLMRSPTDPYHDRLIASYSQIRRFLPGLIAAIHFESTNSAAPILAALNSLDAWFQDQPRTTSASHQSSTSTTRR